MKNILAIILVMCGFIVGNYYGSHNFIWGYDVTFTSDTTYEEATLPRVLVINLNEAYKEEKKLSWAYRDMLWQYYWYMDFEVHDPGVGIPKGQGRHGNFMMDVVMESHAYEVADSILQGDWEDFDCPPEEDWLATPW